MKNRSNMSRQKTLGFLLMKKGIITKIININSIT